MIHIEIKCLEEMIEMHLTAYKNTYDKKEQELYSGNIHLYMGRYKELTGRDYVPKTDTVQREGFEWGESND